jgi:hypothetical protein
MQSSTSGRLGETKILGREDLRFGLWPKTLPQDPRSVTQERQQHAIAICSYSVKRP